jgi:hypothetical protein
MSELKILSKRSILDRFQRKNNLSSQGIRDEVLKAIRSKSLSFELLTTFKQFIEQSPL